MADGPLPIKARVAFENWLNLLHRAIPPTSSLHSLVSAMLDDFESNYRGREALKKEYGPEPFPSPDKMKMVERLRAWEEGGRMLRGL
jgi:hypothetical protein